MALDENMTALMEYCETRVGSLRKMIDEDRSIARAIAMTGSISNTCDIIILSLKDMVRFSLTLRHTIPLHEAAQSIKWHSEMLESTREELVESEVSKEEVNKELVHKVLLAHVSSIETEMQSLCLEYELLED